MGAKIAVFSAPKAMQGHIGLIQTNAIKSWLALGDEVEVVLLGRDPGVAEIAAELGVKHVPEIETNQYGTPLLNSMMAEAEKATGAPYLCMINADIILTASFKTFVDRLPELPQAVYIGLRSDLDLTTPVEFANPRWEEELLEDVHRRGKFRGGGDDSFNGTDYYVYPRGFYRDVPPFAIGRFFWDSWLIASPWRRGLKVVDASSAILAIHQNHNYGHVKSGAVVDMYRYWSNPELKENHRLAKGFLHNMGPREAQYRFVDGQVVKAGGRRYFDSQIYNLWYYYPIMVRATPLFRSGKSEAYNYFFPFDAATGRHRFSRKGALKYFVRPVFYAMPERARGAVLQAVARARSPRQTLRAVKAKLSSTISASDARRASRVDRRPAPNNERDRVAGVHCWFTENAKAGERVVAPKELHLKISGAFGYGFFEARRRWSRADLDVERVILSRQELDRIPSSALAALYATMAEYYRDEHYAVLSRHPAAKSYSVPRWPELETKLREGNVSAPTITAVLNVWKRSPELLKRQIDGLLAQSIAPSEIWVCAFGGDERDQYETVVESYASPLIHFFAGSKNLRYHGRFQLALQADSDYVAFIDDDIVIGSRFLERCAETMRLMPDAGEVGVYGWRRLPEPDENGVVPFYTKGEFVEHLPPDRKDTGAVPVDFLCGFHFLRAEHVALLFRDQPWTWRTGEDFQLAHALRKYAGLTSYLVPVEASDPSTWGLSADWLSIREHATTVGDMDAVRDSLYWRLLQDGYRTDWVADAARTGNKRLYVVSCADGGRRLQSVRARQPGLVVYCASADASLESVMRAFGDAPVDGARHRWGYLKVSAGSRGVPSVRCAETVTQLASIVDAWRVEEIVFDAEIDPVIRVGIEAVTRLTSTTAVAHEIERAKVAVAS